MTQHAAEYTEHGVAAAAGLVPAEMVAATEPDPEIRTAALTDPRLRLLQVAIFLRAPLDPDRARELTLIGVIFGVWTTMPRLTEATVKMLMSTLVLHPDVVHPDHEPRQGPTLDAVCAALARCEVAAHGGDHDLLPAGTPGEPV